MEIRIIISILLLPFLGYSQDNWTKWDNKYPETNIHTLLNREENYAKSVESDTTEAQYYSRMANYRLELIYSGERRIVSEDVKQSMKNVYKIFGHQEYLHLINEIKYEYKFEQNGSYYWLAAQDVLDKSLKKELKKGKTVYLYCLFLNEHLIDKRLYNSFLISEFRE